VRMELSPSSHPLACQPERSPSPHPCMPVLSFRSHRRSCCVTNRRLLLEACFATVIEHPYQRPF
jgi:hypothetical protein